LIGGARAGRCRAVAADQNLADLCPSSAGILLTLVTQGSPGPKRRRRSRGAQAHPRFRLTVSFIQEPEIMAPQFSARSILLGLVVLNVIGIGLSEVQRRALVYREDEFLRSVAERLGALEERQVELTSALDRAAAVSSSADGQADRFADVAASRQRDATRISQARTLQAALERYRASNGAFPHPFRNNSVEDLSTALVGGRYLDFIPKDPSSGQSIRYTTDGAPNGERYGLKVPLENVGDCLIGVGIEGSGWWGNLRPCPSYFKSSSN